MDRPPTASLGFLPDTVKQNRSRIRTLFRALGVVGTDGESPIFGKSAKGYAKEDNWGQWHDPVTGKFVTKPRMGIRYGQKVASRL
jgi:hypothetical protein